VDIEEIDELLGENVRKDLSDSLFIFLTALAYKCQSMLLRQYDSPGEIYTCEK
jgi:hypothetical protein